MVVTLGVRDKRLVVGCRSSVVSLLALKKRKKRIWASPEGGDYMAFLAPRVGTGRNLMGVTMALCLFWPRGEKLMIPHLRGT